MHLFPSRLAQGHQSSLRASTELYPFTVAHADRPLPDQALPFVPRKPPSVTCDLASESPEEDFEEITYDELRLSICPADPAHFAPVFDYQRAYNHSLLSRSRSSLSRLRKLSRTSVKKSREVLARSRLREFTVPDTEHVEHPLAVSLRRPSFGSSSGSSSSPQTPPLQTGSIREVEEYPPAVRAVEQEVIEPNSFSIVPAATRTPKARSLTSSLKRLRTLSKSSLFTGARRDTPQVCQVLPVETSDTSSRPSIGLCDAEGRHLPDLVFDRVDFSDVFEDQALAVVHVNFTSSPQDPPLPSIEVIDASPRPQLTALQLQLPGFQFVDPCTLAASLPASAVEGISLFGSTAPSPSWLSRNVENIDSSVIPTTNSPPPLPIPPPPSPPLYIVPRFLRPDSYYLRGPEIEYEFTTAPQTPQSTTSSLTLYNPSQRASFLAPSSVIGSRPTSYNRLSVIYRRSIVDNQNIHSLVAYNEERDSQDIIRNTSLNVFLVSSETSDQSASLTPLALEYPLSSFPESVIPITPKSSEGDTPNAIFVPSPEAEEYSEAVNFQPPPYLISFVKQVLRNSFMSMNLYTKEEDTIDGGAVNYDYSDYEWFKDPPPRPEPQPQPTTDNYVPQPGVVEQNEAFDFALRSAPNVLYARFKQFGQLGVLAWCSEFSELIDALKQLGFEGNMFVSTRTQALKTCEEILRLKLEIQMQIIIMYLSSQIARLRRFLDSDRQWDDYPKPSFPLDYAEYSNRDRER